MGRPEVSFENADAVYDYYEQRRPKPALAKFVHAVFGHMYKPRTEYAAAAEQQIADHFAAGGRIILAANHISLTDPFILAALAEQEKALRPLRGTTIIPGKAPIFAIRPFRPVLDNFVALPTFRDKDVADLSEQMESHLLRARSTQRLLDICTQRANEGYNIAIFPQGTRRELAEGETQVRHGIGKIACGIEHPDQFLITPLGIHYQEEDRFKLRPGVYIGEPFALAATAAEVTAETHARLRACVAEAKSI